MPTFKHGKNAHFMMDNSAGTLTNISDVLNEVSLPREIETAETTVFGDQDKTYIIGLSDATISLSGMFDATVNTQFQNVITSLKSGSITSVTFRYGPSGSGTGAPLLTGEALVTSYEISSPVGDLVTFSADLQCTGSVTASTYA